jgi:hypothetical protein
VPDSELAGKAKTLAEQAHSKVLLNHVHRTWWFAEFIGKKREMNYDSEGSRGRDGRLSHCLRWQGRGSRHQRTATSGP